jgi:cytochrome P450
VSAWAFNEVGPAEQAHRRQHAIDLMEQALEDCQRRRRDAAVTNLAHALVVALDHDPDARLLMQRIVTAAGGFA